MSVISNYLDLNMIQVITVALTFHALASGRQTASQRVSVH
jgi:hypothetical protein